MCVTWNNGLYFTSCHKDFTMHIGGWFQNDSQWWSNKQALKAAPPAGIGEEVDGDSWRRIRIQMDGTCWEVCEFNCIYALENNTSGPVVTTAKIGNAALSPPAAGTTNVVTGVGTFNQIGFDEFWFGVNKLPIIGTVRFGHQKVPQGLEGDQMSSSRVM